MYKENHKEKKPRSLNSIIHLPNDQQSEELDAEVSQIIKRIIKLSNKADDPGMAYRNLDTISALAQQLAKKLIPVKNS